jgi:hypothetical protein
MKNVDDAMADIEKAFELDPRDLEGHVLLKPVNHDETIKGR